MEKNLSNRRAAVGRPAADEVATRAPAQAVEHVKVPRIVYEDGFICPICAQAQKPLVRKKVDARRYLQCSKCEGELVHDLATDTVQPMRT